ncbi:Uma2 family endonuclease [Trichothermofontia sp.]
MLSHHAESQAMTLATAKWTIADYHAMIAAGILDDRPVELIHGEIVEMAPEGKSHAYFSTASGNYLVQRLGDRALVRPSKPITLSETSEPEPDIAVVQPLGREYLSHHPYPENIFWLIEYAHASLAKDLEIKRKLYAEAQIPEYWVVNLQTQQLIVFRDPQNGDYNTRITLTEGTIAPLAFPDILMPITAFV